MSRGRKKNYDKLKKLTKMPNIKGNNMRLMVSRSGTNIIFILYIYKHGKPNAATQDRKIFFLVFLNIIFILRENEKS